MMGFARALPILQSGIEAPRRLRRRVFSDRRPRELPAGKGLGCKMGIFESPKHLVILETQHWVLNHRVDSALPGYLMLGARAPTNNLSVMRSEALAELGPLLARAQEALNAILQPEHLYIGRYGHMAGHTLHFHIIPIGGWVKRCFFSDPRYGVLQSFYQPS